MIKIESDRKKMMEMQLESYEQTYSMRIIEYIAEYDEADKKELLDMIINQKKEIEKLKYMINMI